MNGDARDPGDEDDDALFGGAGDDVLFGEATVYASTHVDGGEDHDDVFGGAGDDVAAGGGGQRTISRDGRQQLTILFGGVRGGTA